MKTTVSVVALTMMLVAPALPAKQYVFPAKGQSPEQQAIDEAACKQWAQQQTGIDLAAAPPKVEPVEAEKSRGGVLRGAAVGAAMAEVTDNDTGDGGKAGAIGGLAAQRAANRKAEKQAAEQTAQAEQAAAAARTAEFEKATAACLTGKGYTVQ